MADQGKEKREKLILEVCVDSVESTLAAACGGADRLELCANLVIGGTTPSIALYEAVRDAADICTHVLIRPRFGDFCYSDYEFRVMVREVEQFRKLGADGVAIGILKPDGTLDIERMKVLMETAGEMSVTLHRAFDVCADPYKALEQAKELGIDTILTSGQRQICIEGKELLRELVIREEGQITIQAGAGVNSDVIREIGAYTGIHAFHMSGKKVKDSTMLYRKEDVSMGIPGFSEFQVFQTDTAQIRKAREALDKLKRRI